MIRLISLLLLVAFFYSCGKQSPVFTNSMELEKSVWGYEQDLNTEMEISDTIQLYDLTIDVVHSNEFDYQNLYLNIETTFPDGVVKTSSLSLQLADKSGNWIGNCNSDSCESSFNISENFKFRNLGKHRFKLQQFSRNEQLKGINKVSLHLYNVKEEKK